MIFGIAAFLIDESLNDQCEKYSIFEELQDGHKQNSVAFCGLRFSKREFTTPGRQRQPERHLKFREASIVSIRSFQHIIEKAKIRPPITQKCQKTILFLRRQTFKRLIFTLEA